MVPTWSGLAKTLTILAMAVFCTTTAFAENLDYVGGKTVTIKTLTLNLHPAGSDLMRLRGRTRISIGFFS